MYAPTPRHRLVRLTLLATALGVLGGVAAWALVHLIALLTNLALFGRWGWEMPSFSTLERGPHIVLVAVAGASVISLLARWSPIIKGHGIPEAMEAVLTKQSRIAPRTAIAKPISAAVAIGTGAPFGAEGPIIVTGGALGSLLGQVTGGSPSERKILLAAGAAAGMAATFGAPLASVILAIELLLFEFSTRAFVPLVVAASVAGGMHAAMFGTGPFFSVPTHDFAGLDALPLFALLGLGAGLLAVVINRGLFMIEGLYRRLPLGEAWHPVVGAVLFASVGLAVPRALGVGYDVIGDVLADDLTIATVAMVTGAKLLAWWFALASGTSGGTLAPILLISAGCGSLFGTAIELMFPVSAAEPGAFALVAMAAVFGACTRAPLTSIVFVFELTRDFDVILPLMLATVLAELVARSMTSDSIMTEKLTRRGLRVGSDYGVDPFSTVEVGEIMTSKVLTLREGSTVGRGRRMLAEGRHSGFPIVDRRGHCIGIVCRGDLLNRDIDDDEPLMNHASRDVVVVAPDDLAVTALELMVVEEIEHLPVVGADRTLIGICTRTNLLRVRAPQFDAERRQPRWRPGTGGRRGPH